MPETNAPADRLWWPSIFVDEFFPTGLASPSDWLHCLDDGAHQVRDKDEPEEWSFLVVEGEVVEFAYCEAFQCRPFELAADGTVSFPEGEPTGNGFWLEDDPDFCGDSLEELLNSIADKEAFDGSNIRSCTWNSVAQPHRFTAQDGPPRFVPVEAGA